MRPVYHFISHSHWDREWYKTFDTFRLDLVDMVNSLFDIFATNPDYAHFTLDGQTVVLEDYAEIMPERAAQLRQLIQDGRVSIGPWYVLPDEYLVSGESTVRNLLFGKKAAAPYGPVMQAGYIPDSFSHIAMMPAILHGFDIDAAIVYRGFGGEPGQENSEYRWRAPNGAEVLMIHLPPNGYGDAYLGKNDREHFIAKGRELIDILAPRATTPHRLCMNGGDHHFPEPYLPKALQVMSENCDGEFVHSSIPKYVAAVKDYLHRHNTPLKWIDGELHWGFRYAFAVQSGVNSSRMYLKQHNHACEKLLSRYAEPLLIWATLAGRQGLEAMLAQGWKYLLQNHPHDSICGCSIDPVHREMMSRFEKCTAVGEAVIDKSIRQLFPEDWEGPGNVLVFNPICRTQTATVQAEVEFYRQKIVVGLNPGVHPESKKPLVAGFRLRDGQGNDIPCQILQHDHEAHGLRYSDYSYPAKRLVERFTLLVEATEVPGLGFANYRVVPAADLPTQPSDLRCGPAFLENQHLRVEVKPNGALTLVDKRNSQVFDNMLIFEDGGDAGDEYNYSYPRVDKLVTSESGTAEIRQIETGPLRACLEIACQIQIPASLTANFRQRRKEEVALPITTRVYLYHDQPRVEFTTIVDNTAKDHRLRVLFASGIDTDSSYADSQFCLTKRVHLPVHPEGYTIEVPTSVHPMQRGVTILDAKKALTLAVHGLPEYELKLDQPGVLALTLLRCVARLSGGDLLTRPGGESGWVTDTPEAQCPGTHTFRYALIPHTPEEFARYASVNSQLEAFHLPMRGIRRAGTEVADLAHFGIELAPAALVMSAFKPAEDGRGYVFRFYNPTAQTIAGKVGSRLPVAGAWRTQLNERDGEELTIESGHELDFSIAANDIFSMRLLFGGMG